jgi:hypothetical protein
VTINAQRCNRVEVALTSLREEYDDDLPTTLIDLLADAMHWCAANGEDFGYALAVAGRHYIQELNDEQTDERRLS